jgi:flavin-dependent dehydrogenase
MSVNSDIVLEDNANIAVIGGGPSGSLFSIFALKMAKMIDKNVNVTIFETKNFNKDGPAGCNRCGGVISEHLVQELAVEGITLPVSVIQRGINSYVLHTMKGDVHIESPTAEKRIATVYRGGGPNRAIRGERESFDNFLLQHAIHEGAKHVPLRIDGIQHNSKPVLTAQGKDVMEADLVVGAFGVNSSTFKMFETFGIGYRHPKTTPAFIAELQLGEDTVSECIGNSIHFFLLPRPENIRFAALIPKERYVTLCILGKDIDQKTVEGFLDSPAVKNVLSRSCLNDAVCKCFPKLNLRSAQGAFEDRVVVLGDAGSTRLFKDGIGAAYVMGKAAAKTAVLYGIGKQNFAKHYYPVYKKTVVDNRYGRMIYRISNSYKNIGILTESMVNVVRKEQEHKDEQFPRLSSIVWDTFTGNEAYRSIFMRGIYPGMHLQIFREFVKVLAGRGS